MATCPLCGRKGFFLRLGKHGLCKECEIKLLTVLDKVRIINESMEIVSQSNNVETVLSRIDLEKTQVNEISRIAAGKIDPLSLLGYNCSFSEMSNNINQVYNDISTWVNALFGMIKGNLKENGPLTFKEITQIFEDYPECWVEKYDIYKSIKSLLEQRSKHYGILRKKIKNKYYYYLDWQEEMLEQIQNGLFPYTVNPNTPIFFCSLPVSDKIPFTIKSGRIPEYPDFNVLSDLEYQFMIHLKNSLIESSLTPSMIELTRLSDETFNVFYKGDSGCYVGKINLRSGHSSPDKYAVMKNGQKRAKRVLDSEEEANAYMEQHGGDYIELRPGRVAHYYMQYSSGKLGTDTHFIESSDFQDYINGISYWIDYIKECQKPFKFN